MATAVSGSSPAASLSATNINFGNQAVGTPSATQVVTLTNGGTVTLNVTGVTLSGAQASDFAQTNNCVGSLAAVRQLHYQRNLHAGQRRRAQRGDRDRRQRSRQSAFDHPDWQRHRLLDHAADGGDHAGSDTAVHGQRRRRPARLSGRWTTSPAAPRRRARSPPMASTRLRQLAGRTRSRSRPPTA